MKYFCGWRGGREWSRVRGVRPVREGNEVAERVGEARRRRVVRGRRRESGRCIV